MSDIYLAARYSRRDELNGYKTQIEARGHTVTSVWLTGAHDSKTAGPEMFDPEENRSFAQEDLANIMDSDYLIAFTEPPGSPYSRGGRHVELGYALGITMIRTMVVGYRENVFCFLPEVEFYERWEDCLATLR